MTTLSDADSPAGPAGFRGLLIAIGLMNRNDLSVAEQYARREGTELVDAIVSLGLLPEHDAYLTLGRSVGVDLVAIDDRVPSELAVRLVPERVARTRPRRRTPR
jgi:hypothetical protein